MTFKLGKIKHHQTLLPEILSYVPKYLRIQFLNNLSQESKQFLVKEFTLINMHTDQFAKKLYEGKYNTRNILNTDHLFQGAPYDIQSPVTIIKTFTQYEKVSESVVKLKRDLLIFALAKDYNIYYVDLAAKEKHFKCWNLNETPYCIYIERKSKRLNGHPRIYLGCEGAIRVFNIETELSEDYSVVQQNFTNTRVEVINLVNVDEYHLLGIGNRPSIVFLYHKITNTVIKSLQYSWILSKDRILINDLCYYGPDLDEQQLYCTVTDQGVKMVKINPSKQNSIRLHSQLLNLEEFSCAVRVALPSKEYMLRRNYALALGKDILNQIVLYDPLNQALLNTIQFPEWTQFYSMQLLHRNIIPEEGVFFIVKTSAGTHLVDMLMSNKSIKKLTDNEDSESRCLDVQSVFHPKDLNKEAIRITTVQIVNQSIRAPIEVVVIN